MINFGGSVLSLRCTMTTMIHIARVWQKPIHLFLTWVMNLSLLSTSQLSNPSLNSLDSFSLHQALRPKLYILYQVLISDFLLQWHSTLFQGISQIVYIRNLAQPKQSIHRRIKFAILLISATSLRMEFGEIWAHWKPYPGSFMTGNPFTTGFPIGYLLFFFFLPPSTLLHLLNHSQWVTIMQKASQWECSPRSLSLNPGSVTY